MAIWIFQALVDLLLVNVALFWMLSRKRARFLEAQVDRLEREIESFRAQLKSAPAISSKPAPVSAPTPSPVPASALAAFVPAAPAPRASLRDHSASINLSLERPDGPTAASAPEKKAPLSDFAPEPPRGNLVEKRPESPPRPLSKAEAADVYDRASQMLARGLSVKDISRQTGLSMAELQLMGKVSIRTQ